MRPITDYLISDEKRKEIQDGDKMLEYLAHNHTLQAVLGFADDILLDMYEVAFGLFEAKRYAECIDAFIFLTTVNPNVSSFWLGLGSALQMEQRHDEALAAYKVAITKDPERLDGYLYAARCCMQMKEFEEGQKICDVALELAKDHPENEQLAKMIQDVRKMKRHLSEGKRKHRS
jgi:type III secretion system low calcium response chaperone LcrH/SycD